MYKEANYWTHLESTQGHWHPEFVRQLANQEGAETEDGRAAVITFQDGAKPSARTFSKSRELRRYIDESTLPSSPGEPACRRAFVLEGLPKAFIEVLGSSLCVPPSFFSEHWAHPGQFMSISMAHPPRQYNGGSRFSFYFPRLHWVKIGEGSSNQRDLMYIMPSSINMLLARVNLFGEFRGPFRSDEKLSCWILLLVDPPLKTSVIGVVSSQHQQVEALAVDYQSFEDGDLQSISKGAAGQDGSWYLPIPAADDKQKPQMKSMFDDIINLYPFRQNQSISNPMTITDICRQLVLSAWTARLRFMEVEIIRKQSQMSIAPSMFATSYHDWLDASWTRPWKSRDFGGLMDQIAEAWESEAWETLRDTLQTLKKKVNIMSEAYMQAASVRESIAANKQAQHVGYLTSLATLFVPMSFIAAVFSMGGDYAAGQKSFHVFWAISVPVGAMAFCAFFFGASMLKSMHTASLLLGPQIRYALNELAKIDAELKTLAKKISGQ
ncbi:hypothetical protein FSARC_14488 [Fusarium sarcochroum]|uniref:Uncharacterized protein n=1 Tax=Fusarium sarcochroum TaxID=1208366 RepID=A0A8H4WPJ2_9HYPO|nr:hypothetical protein FSARC_14488 [Fusarium sarcochroum]